jgi:catechol 2,3-dioxygenase-like lactoylglutathione lyase family enzyme
MSGQPAGRIAPILPVSDVESASRHLCGKLGFTVREAPRDGRDWALLARPEGDVLLVPNDWPPGCAIQVDDVDATCAQLRILGAEFKSGPMNQEYGQRDILVRGPDGYQIRFWAPLVSEEGFASPPDESGSIDVPF